MASEEVLEALEKLLNIAFTDTFEKFWKAYVPNKTPSFEVQKCRLNGPFGRRQPRPGHPRGWLIQIEERMPEGVSSEVTLAHEVIHLALDIESYPMIGGGENLSKDIWGPVMASLHSILVHPVVWHRMRDWGFPVDDHIRVKSTGRLKDLESKIRKYPSRKASPNWENWVFQYVLARLEWGEPEREQIYRMFANLSIGRQGEKCVEKLAALGYFELQRLNPKTVSEAGEMLLHRFSLNHHFKLVVAQRVG